MVVYRTVLVSLFDIQKQSRRSWFVFVVVPISQNSRFGDGYCSVQYSTHSTITISTAVSKLIRFDTHRVRKITSKVKSNSVVVTARGVRL